MGIMTPGVIVLFASTAARESFCVFYTAIAHFSIISRISYEFLYEIFLSSLRNVWNFSTFSLIHFLKEKNVNCQKFLKKKCGYKRFIVNFVNKPTVD